MFSKISKLRLVLAVLAALSLTSGSALAHENRESEKYQFVVGSMTESAYEGFKNGVSIRITKPAPANHGEELALRHNDASHDDVRGELATAPVEGLESSLQVEVTHVPSGAAKIMDLRGVFGEPGHYTTDLIPTAPGQYTFRFFGAVDGEELNETFESGQGTFSDVQVPSALQFPEAVPAVREIEGAARGAQASAQTAQDAAASASTLGIIGIVLGVVGIVSGVGGVAIGRRKG